MIHTVHFILYVTDQDESTAFYWKVLNIEPRLSVPGMTEFEIGPGCVLGLMPTDSIERLLKDQKVSDAGIRAELYLLVDDPLEHYMRSLAAGARELSPLLVRDWGHEAAYSIDMDGNVIAFARNV